MIPSDRCIEMIKRFEGYSAKLYNDVGGRPTIGYGHLVQHNELLWVVDGISGSTAMHLLMLDLERIGRKVTELTQGLGLKQNEFDALVSFAFNVGPEELSQSTLLRLLKAGDYQGAADQLLLWDHCAGKVVKGLYERRVAERDMFLGQAATAA